MLKLFIEVFVYTESMLSAFCDEEIVVAETDVPVAVAAAGLLFFSWSFYLLLLIIDRNVFFSAGAAAAPG